MRFKSPAFTLIELLVVVGIIGILATIGVASLSSGQARSRDAKRLADMRQIMQALDIYNDQYGNFPANTDSDDTACWGYDIGPYPSQPSDTFIQPLSTSGIMPRVPVDPAPPGSSQPCTAYRYYRYNAGYSSCPTSKGSYYVLELIDLETSSGRHPSSPGFACGTRDWTADGEWVAGKFQYD